MDSRKSSHQWTPVTEEEAKQINKIYTKDQHTYVRVGPGGYVLPRRFLDHAEEGVWGLPLRPSDVFVTSYPRSGTTWTQELVWLLVNDLDFEGAKARPLVERFPFLEMYMFHLPGALPEPKPEEDTEERRKMFELNTKPIHGLLAKVPESETRFIKTHLPPSLLPDEALNTRVVYVARDVRDVAVSCYHFYKAHVSTGLVCDFKTFYYELFTKDLASWSPYFEHIKEGWALRDHPNFIFIFYEELSKDLKSTARKVGKFLGKDYSDQQLDQLCEYLKFDNFKKNKSVDIADLRVLGLLKDGESAGDQKVPGNSFLRKGKAGGWRDSFDEEMAAHAQRWIEEGLRGTGIRWPQ